MNKLGPNVRKLIVEKMVRDSVPDGGGLCDALSFLSSKGSIIDGAKKATEWVRQALDLVKGAPGSTYTDDEVIAGEILEKMKELMRKK